jgi:CheY-like chemotaxis protein/two-component sensor histidine kinase
LEQNSGTLNISRFDLVELVKEVVEMLRPLIEEKNLKLQFDNLAETTFPTESDYTVVKQILTNVVSNAVKYTTSGSIHITLQHDEKVVLTITDTGIGIDQNDIDKIFKPFSRIDNALQTEGNGFGMYVTKGLVESLHGNISVKSQKGKGTQVTIEFPFERMKMPKIDSEDEIQKRKTEIRNILIFEDDAPLGNMISEYLKKRGCKVVLCRNVEEMDQLLNEISNFDIVLTDMEMIGITGKDILDSIRRRDSQISVWIMTAHDDYSTEQASKDGFDGLITKPIRLNRLDQILHLDNSEISKPINQQFPSLVSLFGDDEAAVREILRNFVETSEKDTKKLLNLIEKDDFENAQQLCHKMHPFLAQLDADYLCHVLIKMDKLRGQDESTYPNWKTELTDVVKKIEKFTESVKINYLQKEK